MRLPKVESLIITVFFLCIALWAVSKCSSKRSLITQRDRDTVDEEDRPVRRDTVYVPQPAPQTPVQQQPVQPPQTYSAPQTTPGVLPKLQNQPAQTATPDPAAGAATSGQTTAATNPTAKYSTLFVTIDGLKVRKTPSLKGALVTKLDLYEQVYFLNKKSEKPEEISLGYEKVTDYWVKIRTKSGKEGWVFGAGVHYYKMKRKGVLE
ncbi:MAG: SH3 domain-containing protein [Chitinophagaceae bacterium]|nr:SH3 domain-containing protein [Chitinophagaceae bacterium]